MDKRIIICTIISVIAIGLGMLFIDIKNNTKKIKLDDNDIIKYELQTSEYFEGTIDTKKYIIDSASELNAFYNIYSDKLNLDTNYLDNNIIFIQVEQESSGSVEKKLVDVLIYDDDIYFKIKSNEPEIGTCDMAFWYYVAIIPKDKLKNLNLNSWIKPSSELDEK